MCTWSTTHFHLYRYIVRNMIKLHYVVGIYCTCVVIHLLVYTCILSIGKFYLPSYSTTELNLTVKMISYSTNWSTRRLKWVNDSAVPSWRRTSLSVCSRSRLLARLILRCNRINCTCKFSNDSQSSVSMSTLSSPFSRLRLWGSGAKQRDTFRRGHGLVLVFGIRCWRARWRRSRSLRL